MKNIILRSISSVALFILYGACSSTADRSAAHPEAAVRVEKVSSGGAQIASAHFRIYGKKGHVSGLVRRQSVADVPPWAHVDVIVLDASDSVVEGVAVNYMPREIPHRSHGGFPQSRYSASLTALPAVGSTIKVIFHSAHRSDCEFGDKS